MILFFSITVFPMNNQLQMKDKDEKGKEGKKIELLLISFLIFNCIS